MGRSYQRLRSRLVGSVARRRRGFGFSLIELLVVVSIIAILSAIAVPNFLEAQTRSKVSRMLADMRTMATGVEAYAVDAQGYPPRRTFAGGGSVPEIGDVYWLGEDVRLLTTPVSYLSSIPVDVFKKLPLPSTPATPGTNFGPEDNVVDYWAPLYSPERTTDPRSSIHALRINRLRAGVPVKMEGYTLFSLGPDQRFGAPGRWGNYPTSPLGSSDRGWSVAYDPSNGTTSAGNIYRFQKQMEPDVVFNEE
ncbi:MAG: prepilin-type N-terminal cleavage/methylation domain-containing protein [Candidatus Sumerlaeia bacterium]|nr:prepilin-type N-terminal cleavage/methylation domain-containing protein [Candidatus Sumerlaeia bacterium]